MARHGFGSGVVGGERELWRAKPIKLRQQVTRGAVQVLFRIMRIDAKRTRGVWHQLSETDCADMGPCAWIKRAFDGNVGAKESQPVLTGQACPAQGWMGGIGQPHLEDQGLDLGMA